MRSLCRFLVSATLAINVVQAENGDSHTDHERIRSLSSIQVPSYDYGQLMDGETPQDMLSALQRDGILALRNIPNYQRIRDAYFQIATKCVLETKAEHHQSFMSTKKFQDGTKRATISSEAGLNLNSAGLLTDAACPGYRERYLEFSRALENAVNSFAQALEKSSFQIYDEGRLISMREMINEATRLDHFHLYEGTEHEVEAIPTSKHAQHLSAKDLSMSLHEDRGLFIVMASPKFSRVNDQGQMNSMQVDPDDRGLIIQQDDGQFVRPILHDAEIVIMMGTGATEWLRTSHLLPPVTHGMKMLTHPSVSEDRVVRAFFGKMILLPLSHRVYPSRLTFAEILNKTIRHVSGEEMYESKEIGCASNRQLEEATTTTCPLQTGCTRKTDSANTECQLVCNRNHPGDVENCATNCHQCVEGEEGTLLWMQCVPKSDSPAPNPSPSPPPASPSPLPSPPSTNPIPPKSGNPPPPPPSPPAPGVTPPPPASGVTPPPPASGVTPPPPASGVTPPPPASDVTPPPPGAPPAPGASPVANVPGLSGEAVPSGAPVNSSAQIGVATPPGTPASSLEQEIKLEPQTETPSSYSAPSNSQPSPDSGNQQDTSNSASRLGSHTFIMNVIAEIKRINERELELGVPFKGSWHQKYKDSAWVYIGGLSFELTEGDVICVMSQFGEIEDINLIRDPKTGKSKGFAFLKYENQKSTVLAVDNLNGYRLLDRLLRVDHVLKYRLPKESQMKEELLEQGGEDDKMRGLPGHAYEGVELANGFDINQGQNVFVAPKESRKEKKERKKKAKKAKKQRKEMEKIESKRVEWFQQVRNKRLEQKAKEEELQNDPIYGLTLEQLEAQSSVTGWRGRCEPDAKVKCVKRGQSGQERVEENEQEAYNERERRRRAAFGGVNRIR
uniref:Carbohydratebinding protein putative n=1 Tax=Albugo laibachii Nc14 TaxID=890382 RepID=F0WP19_9STRA|nr:carbohydratebinding protein putative [Albugo laibachii Nc14]|eukprot:CCA23063.1 carbohydratebinding protein putative [Albugo laibachii Nc14]